MKRLVAIALCLVFPLSVNGGIGDVYYCIGNNLWWPASDTVDINEPTNPIAELGLKLVVKRISEDEVEVRGGTDGAWDTDFKITQMDELNNWFLAYHSEDCAYAYCRRDSFQFLGDQFLWVKSIDKEFVVVWGACEKSLR